MSQEQSQTQKMFTMFANSFLVNFLAHIFEFVFLYTLGLFQLFEGALEDMSEIQMYKPTSLMVGAVK